VACAAIFSLKNLDSYRIPRRHLKLADKIALLEEIKNQPPNPSRRQLMQITGVPKSTITRVTQQQEELRDEWKLRHK
jgi:hypothetical protein